MDLVERRYPSTWRGLPLFYGEPKVGSWVIHETENHGVDGSIPPLGTR
jgi:hypothetical protein